MDDQLPDHLLSVYRYAMRLCRDQHLAEDLTQDAMLRAVRQYSAQDEPLALRVWLLRVVQNLWVDWCRRQSLRRHESIENSEPTGERLEPLDRLTQSDEVFRAVAAMNQLPERQRTVLHLVACEEMSISETAQVLQISPEAVRSSLSVARAQMRRMLMSPEDWPQRTVSKEQT